VRLRHTFYSASFAAFALRQRSKSAEKMLAEVYQQNDSCGSFKEMQQNAYNKNKREDKRIKQLEALMACVMDLSAIEQQTDSLLERLNSGKTVPQLQEDYLCFDKGGNVCDNARNEIQASPWYRKESKSHPGKFFWVHSETGKTVWKNPNPEVAIAQSQSQRQKIGVSHFPMPQKKSDKFAPVDDAELSTDCGGYTSMSDYDSDVPHFCSWAQEKRSFRADAPAFQPASSTKLSRETLLSRRAATMDCVGAKHGFTTRRSAEIAVF